MWCSSGEHQDIKQWGKEATAAGSSRVVALPLAISEGLIVLACDTGGATVTYGAGFKTPTSIEIFSSQPTWKYAAQYLVIAKAQTVGNNKDSIRTSESGITGALPISFNHMASGACACDSGSGVVSIAINTGLDRYTYWSKAGDTYATSPWFYAIFWGYQTVGK